MTFYRGSSSSGAGGDGDSPSSWPSSLGTPEAEELCRFGLLVPPGCRLPHEWKIDKDGYPTRGPAAMAEERRTHPGGQCNIIGHHQFWDGKVYDEVIAHFRLAAAGITPDLTGGRRGSPAPTLAPAPPLHPRPPRRRDARGRRRSPAPAPATAPAPADPPAPPAVELPPEQIVLREDGDPDDMPGLLVALRASEAAAAAAAAREAAEVAAAVEAAAAMAAEEAVMVPEEEDEPDDIDWDGATRSSSDDDGGDGDDGAVIIDLAASDEE